MMDKKGSRRADQSRYIICMPGGDQVDPGRWKREGEYGDMGIMGIAVWIMGSPMLGLRGYILLAPSGRMRP